MAANIDTYLAKITAQHRNKPDFVATVSATVQPFADLVKSFRTMASAHNIDVAVGDQLDTLGLWIGQSRELAVPLEGIYFSFDTAGLGWDEGTWKGPFDPFTGLTSLPDDSYRRLLYARIVANRWDGTVEGAYEVWNTIFAGGDVGEIATIVTEEGDIIIVETGVALVTGSEDAPILLIQDNADMSITFALIGDISDATLKQLYITGLLTPKPTGVRIAGYLTQSDPDAPYFGFDVQNDNIAGWDTGAWAINN